MTEYYAVREVDCTPEQIEQIYSLAKANMAADFLGYNEYEPDCWEFIIFKESEEIYQCLKDHLNQLMAELITPEEAIQRLFATYLEN